MRAKGTFALIFMLALIPGLLGSICAAEEPEQGWKKQIVGGINITQASFDNWAQGGENAFAWQVSLDAKFVNLGPKHEWSNSGKTAYGMAKIGDDESRKSVDEVRFETVYMYKAGFYVDPYAAATAQTQFAKGYLYEDSGKTAVSDFLDPAYFTQSLGVSRSFNDVLRSRVGVSLKETITDAFPVPYADDPETDQVEDTRTEVGMESVTDLSLKISENLLFTSKIELFSNLEATKEIDVSWDNLLTAKVEEYVNVTLNVKVFYDRDISRKRQIKQALALGLTYSFM
jgi:hypothetical protein